MSSATYKVTSGREEMDLESPICQSSEEYDAVDKEKRRRRMIRTMKWTLALILVVSVVAGITHAYAVPNNNHNARSSVCPRGQIRVRDKCVNSQSGSSQQPTTTPRPLAVQQKQPRSSPTNSTIPTCPPGQTMRNNKCTPKQCPQGMALNAEGKCACAPGFRSQNNRCVSEAALENCRGGRLSKKGNCVLPTPAPAPKVCPQNTKLNAKGKCEAVVSEAARRPCPAGQRKNKKGSCIPIVVGQSCGQDLWVDANGNCGPTRVNNGCAPGKERNGLGNCVKTQICTGGQVKDAQTGVCVSGSASNTVGRG